MQKLDLADEAALVDAADPGYATSARDLTEIEVTGELSRTQWGEATVHFGEVRVTRQVTSFVKRRLDTGLVIGEEALDLPPRTLPTRAVWWTISPAQRDALAAEGVDLAGAAHAAEHASIALLPLVASCDRWDIGGVSFELNPGTGRLTVFVYDGHPGGAGFAERGYQAPGSGCRPPPKRSPPAPANPAAPPASSPPNAATATNPSPSPARSSSCPPSSPR